VVKSYGHGDLDGEAAGSGGATNANDGRWPPIRAGHGRGGDDGGHLNFGSGMSSRNSWPKTRVGGRRVVWVTLRGQVYGKQVVWVWNS